MAELEDKLNSLLSNPQLMGQIMNMAQALGQEQPSSGPETPSGPPPKPQQSPLPNIDPGMLQQAMQLFGSMQTDKDQQALLQALRPYLGSQRLNRLERAMQAARLAKLATGILGSQGGNHV